jgi:hypothetical protein
VGLQKKGVAMAAGRAVHLITNNIKLAWYIAPPKASKDRLFNC